MIIQWWREMTRTGQRRCHDLTYGVLHAILQLATDDELIPVNPCRIRGAGRHSDERDIDPLSPDQIFAIAGAMAGLGRPQWSMAVLLSGFCGLRSGELRELRRKDVDLDKCVVHISRAVTGAGKNLHIGTPKSKAGRRNAPIPAALIPALKDHLKDYVGAFPDCLIITSQTGDTLSHITWGKNLGRASYKALGVRVTPHDLRHSALTELAVAGATLKELQVVAGHTTPAMAMRYQEVAQTHLGEVVARVSDRIANAAS